MPVATENVEKRWEALWLASPQRSPFSRLDYLHAVADAAGLELSVHFVGEGDNEAGAAVTWRRRGPYRSVVVPPFTPVSALLLRDAVPDSEVHARSSPFGAILRELEQHYHAVHLHLHPTLSDVRSAVWRGWKAQPLYTYVRELADRPRVTEGWSSSAARNFRSNREAYEVVTGPDAATAAAALCEASYARHGRTAPLARASLEHLVGRTAGFHAAYAVRRRDGSRRVDAAVLLLMNGGRAYYWVAGSIPGSGMTVLIGELFADLAAGVTPLFDFMGANTPTIAEFKRRFGCRLETYYAIRYYSRLDVALLHHARELFGR